MICCVTVMKEMMLRGKLFIIGVHLCFVVQESYNVSPTSGRHI